MIDDRNIEMVAILEPLATGHLHTAVFFVFSVSVFISQTYN